MERVLFVDGVFPDFSLLKEVLLPPCLEADPPTVSHVEEQWRTAHTGAGLYSNPRDVAAALETGCSAQVHPTDGAQNGGNAVLQYPGVTERGSPRSACKRSHIRDAPIWLPVGGHFHNSPHSGDKMAILMQMTEPNTMYSMEETTKLLPKVVNQDLNVNHKRRTDLQSTCTLPLEPCYTAHLWHCPQKSPQSSVLSSDTLLQSTNAMELLNLISIQCSSLRRTVERHEEGFSGGCALSKCDQEDTFKTDSGKQKDECPLSSEANSVSANVTQGENATNAVDNGKLGKKYKLVAKELLFKEERTSTSCEVPVVCGDNVQYRERERSLDMGNVIRKEAHEQGFCGRKTLRKQKNPTKSVEKLDPSFKGIEFQMHLGFEQKIHDGCTLRVTSFYRRKSHGKSIKSKRKVKLTSLSSGSEDDQSSAVASRSKRCASCKTQKTPLWRDAEDGTPLCNACGIRYKKYRVRCYSCWNIPKRDAKSYSKYCDCGGMFNMKS